MNPSQALNERLLDVLRRRGTATARELGAELGLSQPSVSRVLSAAAPRIARIGKARRTRYAAVRNVRGLGHHWPLYRLDTQGLAHEVAQLTALRRAGCLVGFDTTPAWLRDDFAEGLFPGLPWFLDDQRPQGFLGRQFAHQFATSLGFPHDLLRWDEDMVLAALLLHGDDGPGNFVLGDTAMTRVLHAEPATIPADMREAQYASLADAALAGEAAGSSAAGEQPKFTACVEDADNGLRHVIVKFSEPVDGNPAARRWADLLLAEHIAAHLLTQVGHPAAVTQLVRSRGRLCLESTRFDRIGAHGRRGLVTIAAWSDAHAGERDNWLAAARRMCDAGWLGTDDMQRIAARWWFGRLIGNTDMHFGNLSFFLDDALPLALAPSYDMLPMHYRPSTGGALPMRELVPSVPLPGELAPWQTAAVWASEYWQTVAAHSEISADFRRVAQANGARITLLQRRFNSR